MGNLLLKNLLHWFLPILLLEDEELNLKIFLFHLKAFLLALLVCYFVLRHLHWLGPLSFLEQSTFLPRKKFQHTKDKGGINPPNKNLDHHNEIHSFFNLLLYIALEWGSGKIIFF